MKYEISKIKWDIDEDYDDDGLPITAKDMGLPAYDSKLVIDTDKMEWELDDPNDTEEVADMVSDWLSDVYGFCHDGFRIKKIG